MTSSCTPARLDSILAHNAGDMTATLQAGVPLAAAQEAFAQAGQMLSLDPPRRRRRRRRDRRRAHGATIGGIVATADSGPLAHRYGGPRDLIVGATVALADGTVAKSGGTVIKNVAGYDIAKLMAGSFGTLGLLLSVNVRLHPRPERTATVVGSTDDAADAADGGARAGDGAGRAGGAGRRLARRPRPAAGAGRRTAQRAAGRAAGRSAARRRARRRSSC